MWEVGGVELGGGAENLRLARELKPDVMLFGGNGGRDKGGGLDIFVNPE